MSDKVTQKSSIRNDNGFTGKRRPLTTRRCFETDKKPEKDLPEYKKREHL